MSTDSKNCLIRENQQATCPLTETERAWLAGFLDADGTIRLRKGQKNANPNQRSLVPTVFFYNTCRMTIDTIDSHLDRLGLTKQKKVSRQRTNSWVTARYVEVASIKQCRPLLRILAPLLVTKRVEALIVLEFMERRLAPEFRQKAYCSRDYLAFAGLKWLKETRSLRDYTPSIEEVFDQDIVRTNARALEAAETTARLTPAEQKERVSRLIQHRWHPESALPIDAESMFRSRK